MLSASVAAVDTARDVIVAPLMELIEPPSAVTLYGVSNGSPANWAAKLGSLFALAPIPGVSAWVVTPTPIKEFSLMSIPTIIASGVLLGLEVAGQADVETAKLGAVAAIMSFIAALAALGFMMRLLRSVSFTPYVIYRVVLGLALLWIAYG